MDFFDRFVADATLWNINNPFKRKVIGGLIDDAQIGNGVANFSALIETKTTNYPIVNANLYKAIFKFTRLMLRADEINEQGGIAGRELGSFFCSIPAVNTRMARQMSREQCLWPARQAAHQHRR